MNRLRLFLPICFLSCLLFAEGTFGQETKPPRTEASQPAEEKPDPFGIELPNVTKPKPAKTEEPRETATEREAQSEPKTEVIRSERSIYVPYEDLETIFEEEGRGVFLPYKEFLELWNQLTLEKEQKKAKPPTDGVVSSASYTATVEGEDNQVLAIEALLQAESFKDDGWAVVPLIKSGLNIAEAETGDATLHLGENGYELILPEKGQYEIKLKIYAKIQRSAGRNQVGINLPKAGVSKFEAVVPEKGWDFEIKPGAAFSTQPEGADDTRLSFFFGEAEHFDIIWQKQGEESTLQPLLFVESDAVSRIVPGALQTDLSLDYRILRTGVDRFTIAVPAGQEILNVTGDNIKEWDVSDMNGSQQLVVQLHSPAKDRYLLKIGLEEAIDSLPTEFSIPRVEASGVVRQRGNVVVQTSRELEVETVYIEGLTQQSLANTQQDDKTSLRPHGSFRFLDLLFNLTLSVKKAEPIVEVASWTRFKVDLDLATFTTRFDYNIKRVGIFDTEIRIPEGYENVEATGDPVDDFSEETDDDGNRILHVTFKNRSEGDLTFNVTGRLIREATDSNATVPVFEPLNVEQHEGKVGLEIHTSLDPRTEEEGDLRQQDVSLLADKLPGSGPLQIGFRYRGAAAPAQIAFTAKKPQVTGEVFTLVEVREQIIRYEWTVSYNVLYAGVDTFVIEVPESIAADLRHDGPLIKEVIKNYAPEGDEAPAAADGNVLWAIVLRDKKMGNYQLKLTLNRAITAAETADADANGDADNADDASEEKPSNSFTVVLPEIQLKEIQTETGQIAVVKDDNLEILDASTSSLEPIDPKELRGGLSRAGIFLTYKYRRHPLSLSLEVSRNQFLPVPQAVVTYASLTSVVSGDRAVTSEVIYWVKNNAKQFFSVSLPEGGKMVSDIYVDGQPQQPMSRAGEDVVLIRLPVGDQEKKKSFPVRFVYEIPSANPGKRLGMAGSVTVPTAELLDAEILQSQLRLFLPDDYQYRKFDSSMHLPLRERGWTRFRNAFDWLIPTLGPQIPVNRPQQFAEPPQLNAKAAGGFDLEVPTGGQPFTLHRLDSPDDVKVSFRSNGFALFLEALFGLLAFAGGIYLISKPINWRLAYFAAAGLLPLIIAGAVSPTAASFWTAIYLGTFLAAIIWLIRGVPALLRRIGSFLKRLIPKRKSKKKRARKEKTSTPEKEEPEQDSKDS